MEREPSFSNKDLLCPLCCQVFTIPVLLKCGHNACKMCLLKLWDSVGNRECPMCHTVSISARPPIDLALKKAADAYRVQAKSKTEGFCVLHNEKLKFFCHKDEELICLICQTSKQHKIHDCSPVEEAYLQKKREISAKLESLQKTLQTLNKTKEQWNETKEHIKTQADENEEVIKEEFKKLHNFLWEEEKTRLKMLRQEEDVKNKVMCKKLEDIEDQIRKLSSIISDTKTALRSEDLPFLQDYKHISKRTKCNIHEPECIRDILIDSAKHLGSLKYEVWKKMVRIAQYVPITFDPNTAQSNLKFSEELTSVQYSSKLILPDNPERCTSRMCVLGANGFTSGKHSWTVEVGQSKEWHIGVARESIKRKKNVFLDPCEGFWVIGLCNGNTYSAQMSLRIKLMVKKKPEKITIQLDYDKGKIVFIDAEDLTIIHTFKDKFTERIFPYFAPSLYEGINSSPMTICPMTVTTDVK
ncbi:zinc-binding protein A33-like [Thalassophryne amazonica]|uniref:zinc-binding protein A33-like n=1 Tax=Thalassophryne amazonica TaxID=390379 RepID=UPI001471764F|nr:zinc-binding protein A33-like [Thalassophryne amazonica]